MIRVPSAESFACKQGKVGFSSFGRGSEVSEEVRFQMGKGSRSSKRVLEGLFSGTMVDSSNLAPELQTLK